VKTIRDFGYPDFPDDGARDLRSINSVDGNALMKKRLGEDFDYDIIHERMKRCVEEELRRDGVPLKPGISDAVSFLSKNGIRSVIVTSTRKEDALQILKSAGIDNYFDTENETRLRCIWFSPWSRFFRGSLIRDNSIFFDEIRYSNDNLFSATCGVKAKMIAVRDKSFYCVTESANSLTSNFMKKPGELSIRADAFFRAQMVLHDYDYQIDEGLAFDFLRRLFTEEKKMFVINFKRMRKMGYKKTWLLRELFKNNSRKARIKRVLYAYVVTCF
jgi:hypothetical protein